jgi:hypothetical protein
MKDWCDEGTCQWYHQRLEKSADLSPRAASAVQLNDKLGSLNRCQGGLFSSLVDKSPMDMCFRMRPGLTAVRVIDFSYVHSVGAEVEVVLPEESGIVQIEVQPLSMPIMLRTAATTAATTAR